MIAPRTAFPGALNLSGDELTGDMILSVATPGQPSAQTTLDALANFMGEIPGGTDLVFATKVAAEASTDLRDAIYLWLDGFIYEYSASGSRGVISEFYNADSGKWFVYKGPIFYQAAVNSPQIGNGDLNACVTAAYKLNLPIFLTTQTVAYLDTSLRALQTDDTPEARHAALMGVIQWRKGCLLGNGSRIVIRLTDLGMLTVSAWDWSGTGVTVSFWDGQSAGILDIQASTTTTLTVSAPPTFGARGVSDANSTIERGANQYKITVPVTPALPAYVTVGYGVGLRNFQGNNDCLVASGATIIEGIAPDRLSFTATIQSTRNNDLVQPTTIDTAATYQGMLACRVIVPSACLGWDTSYVIGASQSMTGVVVSSTPVNITGITQATVGVVSAPGNTFVEGDTVTIAAVRGMTEVNGRSYIATNVVPGVSFELYDLDGNPVDTSVYDPWTSGGNVRKPTKIQMVAHGYIKGQLIRINGVVGMTQLNGRQYIVGTITSANEFELLNCANAGINSSGYSAYVSGGVVTRVTEVWTGADLEAYFNITNYGIIQTSNFSMAWQGWLYGATGGTMDQDAFFVNTGRLTTTTNTVIAGAGDMCLRSAGPGYMYINQTLAGGGGAEQGVYLQNSAQANLVRTCVGSVNRYAAIAATGCTIVIASCILAGSNSPVGATGAGFIQIGVSTVTGGLRNIYAVSGRVDIGSGVLCQRATNGLDGIGGGLIIGNLSFSSNAVNSQLTANSMGGASSNKGGARWIQTTTGNQGLGKQFLLPVKNRATVTDSGSGVVANTPLCKLTTPTLTNAAGTEYTCVISNSQITNLLTVAFQISKVGGNNTGGIPEWSVTAGPLVGQATLHVLNLAAAPTPLNGSFIFDISVEVSV